MIYTLIVIATCICLYGCGFYVGRQQGIKYVTRRFNEAFESGKS